MSLQLWLARRYRSLVMLFPGWFQAQFGAEMQAVFAQAVDEAATQGKMALLRLCWRELRDWPAAVIQQQLSARQMEVSTMNTPVIEHGEVSIARNGSSSGKSSTWEVFAAILPLLVWGAAWMYAAARDIFASTPQIGQAYHWFLAAHAVTLLGLGVGWWLKFPCWSYLYAGLALTFSAYWAGLAMNGWRIFGFYFLEDGRWSWRAWVPFLALVLIMILLTRSLDPLKRFFTGIWMDWSRLSLLLYGWLVFLLITINLDSIELASEFWQPVCLVLACLAGVMLYMCVTQPWQRAFCLDAGLFAGGVGVMLLGRLFTPATSQFIQLSRLSGEARVIGLLFIAGWILLWLGLVFLPACLLVFQKNKKVAPAI